MPIDFEAAFEAVADAPNLIASIVSTDDVVKYISKNISRLGWEPPELIRTEGGYSTTVETNDHGVYLRCHKQGYDVVMETITVKTLPNGDTVMLERIISCDEESVNKNAKLVPMSNNEEGNNNGEEESNTMMSLLVPSKSVSKIPKEIVHDFVVNGALGIHWVQADGTIAWANDADMAICGYSADDYIGRER
jgi:hypothetical protein